MRMWVVMFVGQALLWLGCGSVQHQEPPDAQGGDPDAPRACPGTEINACGASCVACTATGERQLPSCDGTACGIACVGGAPKCSDNSCSRNEWAFDSNQLDGIEPGAMGYEIEVRTFQGSPALAVNVVSLPPEVSFTIPVCLSGAVDLTPYKLSFRVFFQGGTPNGEQYYVTTSAPSPMSGAFISMQGIQAQQWVQYSQPINQSTLAGSCGQITIQAGSFGAAFLGTIWFDDIKIE